LARTGRNFVTFAAMMVRYLRSGDLMRQLPVLETYRHAVWFAFSNFFTVLRLSWLPFLALAVAFAGLAFAVGMQLPQMLPGLGTTPVRPTFVFDNIDFFLALQIVSGLVQAIVIAAVAVSIHRVILFGDRKPGVFFNFPFGAGELRYVLMGLLMIGIIVAVMGVILGPVALLVTGGDFVGFFEKLASGNVRDVAWSVPPLVLGYLVGWLILIYVFVRLMIWPAAVVATGRLSPTQPWALTRGNVLNLIVLVILIAITCWAILMPFALAWGIVFATVIVPSLPSGDAPNMEAFRDQLFFLIPAVVAFYVAIYVFFVGLSIAVVSYAYKALSGHELGAPIAEAA
jgi:hypothetical protein